MLEGDIGGGLVLQRKIYIPTNYPKYFQIDSSIIARKVGAGSGGFSRFGPTTTLSLSLSNSFLLFGLLRRLVAFLILYQLQL
jgi:hypothetical protein